MGYDNDGKEYVGYEDLGTKLAATELAKLSTRLDAASEVKGTMVNSDAQKPEVKEIDRLRADLANVRASLVEARAALVDMGKEWQVKIDQLVALAKQDKLNNEAIANNVAVLESTIATQKEIIAKHQEDLDVQVEEMARREDEYQAKVNDLEIKHQKQLLDMIDDLSLIGAKPKKG